MEDYVDTCLLHGRLCRYMPSKKLKRQYIIMRSISLHTMSNSSNEPDHNTACPPTTRPRIKRPQKVAPLAPVAPVAPVAQVAQVAPVAQVAQVELVASIVAPSSSVGPVEPASMAAPSQESEMEDILSCDHWKNTKTFKSIKDKETQIKYYKHMNASDEVLQLVELESKPFGSESELIISEIFHLGPRTSTQNDGTRHGKKIEIKTARYWAGKDDCKWQHLEPDHDYEYALLVILDFQGWKVWCIKKDLLMGEMRDKKIVTEQGKQGWWTKKSAILPYLTPIKTVAELDAFIQ